MRGFSFAELLVAMGLVAAIVLTLSATWLYSQHMSAELNKTRLAEQILQNIATEMLAQHKSWNSAQENDWKTEVIQALPQATLSLTSTHLQIEWPSQQPLTTHCALIKKNFSCVGFDIGGI